MLLVQMLDVIDFFEILNILLYRGKIKVTKGISVVYTNCFGILSLIPKMPGAESVTQFHPISLINIDFKIISKAYALCFFASGAPMISQTQTAFIKARLIHDGTLGPSFVKCSQGKD
jgi:hypothetical protein